MKGIQVAIRRIGNSRGIVIPKPLLVQAGLEDEASVEIVAEGDALVLRKPTPQVRSGWAEAARQIALADDDVLVMGEFPNADDAEHDW